MSQIRVLVVDDDPWILRMVSSSLEKKGTYAVETARDGQQAFYKAQAQRPDMIISDVMMPVMDGWALVQQLRADPELADVPVLFLTALGKDEDRLRALGLKPDDYVSKPFRFDDLERRVLKTLAKRGNKGEESRGGGYAQPQQPGFDQRGFGGTPGPPPGGFGGPSSFPQQGGYGPGGFPQQSPGGFPQQQQQGGYGPQGGYGGPAPAPGRFPQQGGGYGPPGQYPGQYQQPHPPHHQPPPQHQEPGAFPSQPSYGPPGGQQAPGPQPPPTEPEAAVPAAVDPGSSGSFSGAMRRTGLSGRLEQLGLSSLLVMMEMERKDGVLQLQHAVDKNVGRIFIRKGQVIQARIDKGEGPRNGAKSVYYMLTWAKGRFHFTAMDIEMDDEVQTSTTSLLMEGARLIDEANR